MNKLTLKYEPDLDFILIAITAPLKDYRLCFEINKQLSIQFSRCEEISMRLHTNEEESWFSHYQYLPDTGDSEFHLLANKGSDGFLIPEMKTTDFFILIKSYIDNEELTQLISRLNKIPEVLVAVEVDPMRLKSKENLIF